MKFGPSLSHNEKEIERLLIGFQYGFNEFALRRWTFCLSRQDLSCRFVVEPKNNTNIWNFLVYFWIFNVNRRIVNYFKTACISLFMVKNENKPYWNENVTKEIFGSPTKLYQVQTTALNWKFFFLFSSLMTRQGFHKEALSKDLYRKEKKVFHL